mgnify:FL=1
MINIYSIKEIVEATNSFLTTNSEKVSKKNSLKKEKKIQINDTENNTKKKL